MRAIKNNWRGERHGDGLFMPRGKPSGVYKQANVQHKRALRHRLTHNVVTDSVPIFSGRYACIRPDGSIEQAFTDVNAADTFAYEQGQKLNPLFVIDRGPGFEFVPTLQVIV